MTPPRRPSRWFSRPTRALGVVVQTLTVLVLLALVAWPERHVERFVGREFPDCFRFTDRDHFAAAQREHGGRLYFIRTEHEQMRLWLGGPALLEETNPDWSDTPGCGDVYYRDSSLSVLVPFLDR